jgi:hypothetical protein
MVCRTVGQVENLPGKMPSWKLAPWFNEPLEIPKTISDNRLDPGGLAYLRAS